MVHGITEQLESVSVAACHLVCHIELKFHSRIMARTLSTYRKDNEGPPQSMAMQLAWRTPVKGHFTNDEQVIPYSVPQPLVARASLLTPKGVSQTPPLLVCSIGFLEADQSDKPAGQFTDLTYSWLCPCQSWATKLMLISISQGATCCAQQEHHENSQMRPK